MLACSDLQKPKPEPYYGGTAPPRRQEFRWSNGKLPRSMDPARSAAAPETDLVRAVYEGLTEIDPQTLSERPAAAEKWVASDDFTTWTFTLRDNARWTNGGRVTADDFVRSWRRLRELGGSTAHNYLLANIVGFAFERRESPFPETPEANGEQASNSQVATPRDAGNANSNSNKGESPRTAPIGVEALDQKTLRVRLVAPDRDFPKLVANPIFRPVFDDARGLLSGPPSPAIVTNGAFRLASAGSGLLTLEPAETYWNRDRVKLERVDFVAAENAEQALAAYRAGEIDAITNAEFEPLALKLFQPYEDFRRWTHAAVNFYEVNHGKPPFDDRRVREALAVAIERERLTEGELEGTTRPALSFLPFGGTEAKIVQDKERARELLTEAGFPNGAGFPL